MHHKYHFWVFAMLLSFAGNQIFAQIVINEASNKNGSNIVDEDNDYESWFELYNAGASPQNLFNYGLTDNVTLPSKWTLPNTILNPGQFLLIFASGKDRKPESDIHHWEQPISDTVTWKYLVPDDDTPVDWITEGFDADAWDEGNSSIGYGDADDNVILPDATRSVYLRYTFSIDDTAKLGDAFLSLDYDDGFVAYLNGNVIALNGFAAGSPEYDELSAADHEASMYGGGVPEHFYFDEALLKTWIHDGENVLCVEVHNVSPGSSDLTARPFFSFGIKDEAIIWTDMLPIWFPYNVITTNLHTNFNIDAEGETIYLSDVSGLFIDSLLVNVEFADQSVGCITDGAAENGIFITPTPAYSNSGITYTGYTEGEATFSLDAGFYTGEQTVSITVPVGCVVYYTTNGEIPTTADALYMLPLHIDATTVLRARLFDAAGILLPGKISTNTYFIDEDISIPVISISTNNDNLYGGSGIFDHWDTDWKKQAYIEYFDTIHINAFEQNIGIKVDGGAGGSRSLPQKSMRVELDNPAYGDGTLSYPLLTRRHWVDDYETFYLRNGSNMSNVLPYKDAFMTRTTDGTYNEHMDYDPVVVFINGEYWGFYELRNKLDEGHFDYAKGVDKDSLDLMSLSYWYGLVLRTLSGSDTDFIEMRTVLATYPTPEDPEYYALADSLLDLQNFTDYIASQMFFANYDWPYNNIKAWRDRGGDNKWKYAIIDVELGLGIGGWSNANSDLIPGLFSPQENIEPLAKLLQNPIYHDYFVNRYADLLNSTFLPERTLAMEDSIYNAMIAEMPRQFERWGYGTIGEQMATFDAYREALRDDFTVRSDKERTHIKNGFDLEDKVEITLACDPPGSGYIKISTLTIFDLPWSGIYFDGVPVQITAMPNTGYTFSNWDASEFITDPLLNGFISNITDDVTFTAHFTGAAAPSEITISEINYHPEASVNAGNWLELWNYGMADVNISGWKLRDADFLHVFTFPENTWLNANARLVIAVDTALFQTQHPDVLNYTGPLGFGLNNEDETILLINLQNTIVQEINYTDGLPWPIGADGYGRTMELNNPAIDINIPSNWFDGCIGGSPGLPYTPCDDNIIISEINYNSGPAYNGMDWVEVYNISSTAVDISGWKFMDDSLGIDHEIIIPDGYILNANDRLVFIQNETAFNTTYPDISNYIGSFNFDLSDNGEWIRIYDSAGILMNSINFDDFSPWPLAADGGNYTLNVIDSFGLMNSGLNWETICEGGSPGTASLLPCDIEIAINNTEILPEIDIYPNPAANYFNMQFNFLENSVVNISLCDLEGSYSKEIYQGNINSGFTTQQVNITDVPAGVYFVKVLIGNETQVYKLIKL